MECISLRLFKLIEYSTGFIFSEIHSESLPSHRFQIVGQFVHFDTDLWFEGQVSKCFCRKSLAEQTSLGRNVLGSLFCSREHLKLGDVPCLLPLLPWDCFYIMGPGEPGDSNSQVLWLEVVSRPYLSKTAGEPRATPATVGSRTWLCRMMETHTSLLPSPSRTPTLTHTHTPVTPSTQGLFFRFGQ